MGGFTFTRQIHLFRFLRKDSLWLKLRYCEKKFETNLPLVLNFTHCVHSMATANLNKSEEVRGLKFLKI